MELPDQPDGHQTDTCPASRVHRRDETRLPTPLPFRLIVDGVTAAGVSAGAVNYVTRPESMGDLMVRKPKVAAKVVFTDSTLVGRHIAAACGELLRPVTFEIGGKPSAIVMEKVDLVDMSAKLIRSCMRDTGQ